MKLRQGSGSGKDKQGMVREPVPICEQQFSLLSNPFSGAGRHQVGWSPAQLPPTLYVARLAYS